jgi:glycosyltransferase involved in cell wall biosynthesis
MVQFSILLPTRKRKDLCIKSIESIINNAYDKKSFEILLAFDNDDESYKHIIERCRELDVEFSYISMERVGYKNLEIYYNSLCEISKGEMLWLWNDDAFMMTKNWDLILKQCGDDFVFDFANNHYPFIFPMVPAKYVKELGHFSLQAHNDTWIEIIFRYNLNICKFVSNVFIYHSRISDDKMGIDYTEIDDALKFTSPDFYSDKFKLMRLEDTNKIITKFFPNKPLMTYSN